MPSQWCHDRFWNQTLFLNLKYPIFTNCFQYSILLIPCGIFIILFSLFILFQKYKSQKIIKIPCDFWYLLKLIFYGVIIGLLVTEITTDKYVLSRDSEFDVMYILSYSLLCFTMVLVMLQTEIRRRSMHPVCIILFIFWSTSFIAYLVRFYSNLILLVRGEHVNISFVCLSGLILFLFFLSFILECFSRYSPTRVVINKKVPCPEEYASIISQMTYSWLDKCIYKWYKVEMTEETAFDLRCEDEAAKNTNAVENVFLRKIKEDNKNEKISYESMSNSSANLLDKDENVPYVRKRHPGWVLTLSLAKIFFPTLVVAWGFKVTNDLFTFLQPFMLKQLLEYIQDKSQSVWIGYSLAFIFLFTGIISSLCQNLCFYITSSVSIRVRAAIIGMVYRKTLRLNNEVRAKFTSGEIVNLMSVDAERVMQWLVFSWFIISCPLQIILAVTLLYQELSYAVFAGLGLIICFFPLNGVIMRFTQKYSESELAYKDKRVKLLTEIFNGMKVLKMYAWEKSFLSKITDLRGIELKYIMRVTAGWGLVSVIWEGLPFLVMLVTFITFVFMDASHIITPERAFVSLTLFNLMRFPMVVLPWGLTETINAFVSLKRIGEYLVGEELDKTGIYHLNNITGSNAQDVVVEIREGSFAWKEDDKVILNNINLDISRGKLVAIVGKVGTGKSSLISAILGEMHRLNGSVRIQGKIAYVSQEAWIQNKTVKENVLFTNTYKEDHYNKVIEACSLLPDLEQLPGGDGTEIGERGINLSGGQKQRISLARSVYQNRDIYLLDDPLSAVDAHVGQHLFDKVISNNGILKGKTRILITHGLNWLPKVDEVFVLDSNGCISERGTFKKLLRNGNEFMRFVEEYMEHNNRNATNSTETQSPDETNIAKAMELLKQVSENEDALEEFTELMVTSPTNLQLGNLSRRESRIDEHRVSETPRRSVDSFHTNFRFTDASSPEHHSESEIRSKSPQTGRIKRHMSVDHSYRDSVDFDKKPLSKPMGQLIDDEQAMSGTVKWATYVLYMKSRGLKLFIATLIFYMIYIGIQIFTNVWLKDFTEDFQIVNASSQISMNSSYIPRYSEIIRKRTRYYMSIYAAIGISMTLAVCIYWVGFTIGTVNASKVIHKKLLFNILRSPMEFFDTTPSGRILNRFSKDVETIDHVLPMNISDGFNCLFLVFGSVVVIIYVTPWFAIIILPLAVLYYFIQLFYMPTSRQARRLDSIAASPVFNNFTETIQGVAVIRAFNEEKYFQNLNQSIVDRSSQFKFIQFASIRWLSLRIDAIGNIMVFAAVLFSIISRNKLSPGLIGLSISYSLQITEFLNWLLRQYTDLETNSVALERVREYSMVPSEAEWDLDNNHPEDWPPVGNVSFENYDLRYRDGLPLVLKNINLKLSGGDRIGIVGRTGAGKSSLNLALFRLVEAAGGAIKIDNVDISSLGLHDLRRNLTILPQDPFIFSGTLRENLDPFNKHTEEELFQSLETAHLKDWVANLTNKLDYECGEGGSNLSVGQKQLLCLARALLRKSKVLILDEATASVDVETDRLVMKTIRDYFHASTVIIIAHRINTILDTDKIVVMDNGQVVEMDSPDNLLLIPNGIFKSLHEQSLKQDL